MSKELIEQAQAWQTPSAPIIKALADRIEELEREVERKMSAADFILKERDASRDAEVQQLQMALADTEALELGTAEKCDQLRAHVNRLREALERIGRYPRVSGDELGYEGCRIVAREALATTQEQSLAEYRNKVIEDCAEIVRVELDNSGQAEAIILAMKEQL